MKEIPSPWDAYLRLQTLSSNRKSIVDSYSWGMEEQMNRFLENPQAFAAESADQLRRAKEAGARRARAQAKMRKDCAAELAPEPYTIERQLCARETLALLEASLPPENWMLLVRVAEGHSYEDLAKERGIKPGALRVVTSRLRHQCAHYYAAA